MLVPNVNCAPTGALLISCILLGSTPVQGICISVYMLLALNLLLCERLHVAMAKMFYSVNVFNFLVCVYNSH